MTQRAIRPVTLATLTLDPLSRVKVARLYRRCDIGLRSTKGRTSIYEARTQRNAVQTLQCFDPLVWLLKLSTPVHCTSHSYTHNHHRQSMGKQLEPCINQSIFVY